MNAVYEKNMNTLREYQPSFHIPENIENSESYELITGGDGLANIKVAHKSDFVFVHNYEDALSDAKNQTDAITLSGSGLIVSFGLGMGHEAREIIKKMDKGTNFIIAEPSAEILDIALHSVDLSDIFMAPNVHFMYYENKTTALVFIQSFVNFENYKNLAVFVLKPYVTLFFELARDLMYAIDDLRSSLEMNVFTVSRFTELWQTNAIKNIRHNLNSYLVSDFFDKFQNIPALIVSAGPSLSKNIGQIKGLSDRCVIIAVDTALKPLLNHEVTPHFVVSVDGQPIVAKKFKGLDYSHIPMIYIPTSSPEVLDNQHGTKILSIVQDAFYGRLTSELGKNIQNIEMGGSVATSAFSFAQNAGCNPIILVGQDLGYTNMKSHAEGTAFERTVDISKKAGIFKVPAIGGGDIYTDSILQAYITWFQTYAAGDKTGRTYIDATEGGARLLGFKELTLKETAAQYMTTSGISDIVSNVFCGAQLLSASEKKYIRNNYKEAISFLNEIRTEAKAAASQLKRINELLSKPNPNLAVINNAYSKVARFEQKMNSGHEKLQVIYIVLAPMLARLTNEFNNTQFKNEIEKSKFTTAAYSEFYSDAAKFAEKYIGLLRESLL